LLNIPVGAYVSGSGVAACRPASEHSPAARTTQQKT
jgi:hypothetical protein